MKTVAYLLRFFICALLAFTFFTCGQKKPAETAEAVQDTLKFIEIAVDTTFQQKAGGSEKASWKKIFKKCAKSDWTRTADYMGPTNTLYLGAIKKENGDLGLDLGKLDSVSKELLFNIGADQNTGYVEKIRNDLKVLLGADLEFKDADLASLNAELKTAIANTRQMDLTFTWAVDNLKTSLVKPFLDGKRGDIVYDAYAKDLADPTTRVITKVIRVQNFKGTITLEKDLAASLLAKLKGAQKVALVNGNASIEFKSTSNRVISIESSPKSVFVFAVWSTIK